MMQAEATLTHGSTTLTSTTNTPEELQAALAPPPAESPSESPTESPAPPADALVDDETPAADQQAASEAGKTLAGRRHSFQSRINELTRQREEARLAERREAQRAEALARELAAARTPPPAAEATPRPDPSQFDDQDQYEDALRRWTAREEIRADRQKETETRLAEQRAAAAARAQAEEEVVLRAHAARFAQAAQTLPDFEAVVNQPIDISHAMRVAIIESDLGPQLAYYFGTHPKETAELAELRGTAALRAIGKLEARLEAATPGPTSEAPRPSAPPPVKPVGGGATASRLPLDHPNVSFKEYEQRRLAGES